MTPTESLIFFIYNFTSLNKIANSKVQQKYTVDFMFEYYLCCELEGVSYHSAAFSLELLPSSWSQK